MSRLSMAVFVTAFFVLILSAPHAKADERPRVPMIVLTSNVA
jgi:hypothetical protein